MRLAVALGGSDLGRSGIGNFVRAILPRLSQSLSKRGDQLLALGTRRELDAYSAGLAGVREVELPAAFSSPAASAMFHLFAAGALAKHSGADAMLLPAGNRRLSLTSPIPTVAVVHDLAQLHVRGKYDPLRMFYVRRLVAPGLSRATALVAVSRATQGDVASTLNRSRESIRVVENGVDSKLFTRAEAGDSRVSASRGAAHLEGPYLLYLARFEHPGKNHLRLLRAFATSRARRTHLLALAGADWGGEALVRQEIRDLGLEDRVRMLGFVSDDIVPGLVAGADAVMMVGLSEGFGLPALEALATGIPVVNATTGALPEVVGDLGCPCDPHDEASICAAIDRSIEDAALRGRVALEGPLRARDRDWDKTASGLLEVCSEVCA